jgi:hypothetical protein
LKNTGFVDNKSFRLHIDDLSNPDKDYLNIMGTKYDGVFPVDVGWDEAFVPELLEDYHVDHGSHDFRHFSVIRDNGRYFGYAVVKTAGLRRTVDIYESDDAKTWTFLSANNFLGDQFNAITVVKNRDDPYYTIYVTSTTSSRYRVYVGVTSDPTSIAAPDIISYTEIITDASYNFGSCDVLHLKGITSDTGGSGIRLMCVVRYDDLNEDANGYPNGTPYLDFYLNEDEIDNPAHWVKQFTLAGAFGTDPVFIYASFAKNDNTYTENANLNQFVMLFKGTDNKIYRCSPRIGDPLTSVWEYPNAIDSVNTISIGGWSCINDGYIYNVTKEDDRDAFTLVPTNRDVNILYGADSNGDLQGFAVSRMGEGFDEDLFWISKKQEMNEVDWFKSDEERITLKDGVSTNGKHKRIYLGLRKPFHKILPRFLSIPYANRMLVRYWNGIDWQNFDRMYQNGRTIIDSKVNPIFGFYYDRPSDWISAAFVDIVDGFTYSGLDQRTKSLYWIEISLPSGYAADKEIILKGFRNCYTNLFAWKGRTLFMMENWKYMKTIYTFMGDMDKGIKIDSLGCDKNMKHVLVHTVDDNMYGSRFRSNYRRAETYIFDSFGVEKFSYPLWSESIIDNEYHFTKWERPAVLLREGCENQVTVGGTSRKMLQIGSFDKDFIEDIYYGGSAFSGYEKVGYNVPVPKSQILRKFWFRGEDWELDGIYWSSDKFINNIWIARRAGMDSIPIYSAASIYRYSNSYAYLFASLTHNGLLWEELVNSPFRKVEPGFYAFIEKSQLSRYEGIVQDVQDILIGSYPGAPNDGEVWLIWGDEDSLHADFKEENYSLLQYHSATTSYTFSRPYKGMLIKDLSDSNQLYYWTGYNWKSISDEIIWPGRNDAAVRKIFLEWTVGNLGVYVPYFRDWDTRPDRFISNNTENYYDKKRIITYRDIDQNILSGDSFGGRGGRLNTPDNLKATCAVELPDCSAIKDSPGTLDIAENDGYETDYVRVIEPAAPAIAFGMYAFRDVEVSDSVVRDDTGQVNPYAFSGIGLHKAAGRVRNWIKAFYHDGTDYEDVTDGMNYKRLGFSYLIKEQANPKYIEVCSSTRFFSLVASFASMSDEDNLGLKYLAKNGTWTTISEVSIENNARRYGTFLNETWAKKTQGTSFTFDPFLDDWQPVANNGETGYWIRIETTYGAEEYLRWVVLSGTMLWDNMHWWDDYTITSDKYPGGSPTDAQKRYFDTFIPMSIEYDILNKKLVGCFWNFDPTVNKYYPFKIAFDVSQLYDENGRYYWNWEHNDEIKIVDSDGYNYSKNMKSLAVASPTDAKVLCVDDFNPDGIPVMSNLKVLQSGDKLFQFNLQ